MSAYLGCPISSRLEAHVRLLASYHSTVERSPGHKTGGGSVLDSVVCRAGRQRSNVVLQFISSNINIYIKLPIAVTDQHDAFAVFDRHHAMWGALVGGC